jgi:shikimate kinase
MGRVGHADGRPLLAGLDEASRRERLEEILRDRQAAYESARLVVDTDEQSVEQIVLTIAEDLGIEP